MQAAMTAVGIGAAALVAISAVADQRRQRRERLDSVGFMPWPLISVLSTLIALFAFALALKGGS